MDYGTFFFTNIAYVTVYTVCIGALAWHNRQVKGMLWFTGAQVVGLIKLILQGLEGKIPTIVTAMVINELYVTSFAMQWVGLHWFVVRKPFKHRAFWTAMAITLAVYTFSYFARIPYSSDFLIPAFLGLFGISMWTLWKYGKGQFAVVSRTAALVLCGQLCVYIYRAVLGGLLYSRPWSAVVAHNEPQWLYSLAAAAFLSTFMAMCVLWFLVTELQWELAEWARTDPLTGALNRRSMEQAALRETARSQRYGNPLSMIMLDIDKFKHLNDTRGHAAGDCALQALVRRLKGMLRQQDALARMGGEEFAILLPDTAGPAALSLAERVRQAVADLEIPFEGGPVTMTICAGVAQLNPTNDWEEMMKRADAAMYAAKRRGRNRVSSRPELEDAPVEKCVPTDLDGLKLLHTA